MQVQGLTTWKYHIESSECQKAELRVAIAIWSKSIDEATIDCQITTD